MPDFCISGLDFENIVVIFRISALKICLVAKFSAKINILKFGTKNALFGYFWAYILKTLLSDLKSALSNFSICKFSLKNKNG